MDNNRPTLEQLQKITDGYFDGNAPKIMWMVIGDDKIAKGMAFLNKNEIHLNKEIGIKLTGCNVTDDGVIKFSHEQVEIKEGEQYYFVLLHEIAHFLIKSELPENFNKIRKKITREHSEGNPLDYVEDYLKQKENESDENWYFRVEEFRYSLVNDSPSNHVAVEDWAIKEFNKLKQENNV
jgi:hypothetical protein